MSVVGHAAAVRDRPNLKPIASCRLLRPISVARDLCNASSLVDSQHTFGSETSQIGQVDVEMGSGSGTDHDLGSCSLGRHSLLKYLPFAYS
jgi:hypothetical protein